MKLTIRGHQVGDRKKPFDFGLSILITTLFSSFYNSFIDFQNSNLIYNIANGFIYSLLFFISVMTRPHKSMIFETERCFSRTSFDLLLALLHLLQMSGNDSFITVVFTTSLMNLKFIFFTQLNMLTILPLLACLNNSFQTFSRNVVTFSTSLFNISSQIKHVRSHL